MKNKNANKKVKTGRIFQSRRTTVYAATLIIFSASYLRATDTCCNGEIISTPKVCCDDKPIDPTKQSTSKISLDLQAWYNVISLAAKGFKDITNGNGCELKPGGSLSVSAEVAKHHECCSNVDTELKKITLSASLDFGSYHCTANLLSSCLPEFLASLSLFVDFGAKYSCNGLVWETSCTSPSSTASIGSVTITLAGGVEGDVVGGFITLDGGLSGSGQGTANATLDSSGSWNLASPTASAYAEVFFRVKAGGGTILRMSHRILG